MAQRLEAESPGQVPPTQASEEILDLLRPECLDIPSEDSVLRGFGLPLAQLVIFQKNQGLKALRVWLLVTQGWLHWPVTCAIHRAPQSGSPLCYPCLEIPNSC